MPTDRIDRKSHPIGPSSPKPDTARAEDLHLKPLDAIEGIASATDTARKLPNSSVW
jgi:hypothetical protein